MQPGPPAAGFACSLVNRPSHGREKENTERMRKARDAVVYLDPGDSAKEEATKPTRTTSSAMLPTSYHWAK
ncbi:hypothetical protein G5I_07745 [Acromyrmex echinatior]|uniref:Uncharacterized protein n=1 Tax=Acromyrmex echinatior TaxID=103372 RepID=F4WPM6_ACREC|nr:hypothetical protein G5I_07745 [Acromyrmex echinatior]